MARKKKITTLPAKIELISKTTARVREFDLSHALRILEYQHKTGLGTLTIYNTDLYKTDDLNRTISIREKLESGEQPTNQE